MILLAADAIRHNVDAKILRMSRPTLNRAWAGLHLKSRLFGMTMFLCAIPTPSLNSTLQVLLPNGLANRAYACLTLLVHG